MTTGNGPRRPRSFSLDDPALVLPPKEETPPPSGSEPASPPAIAPPAPQEPTMARLRNGIRWGAVLISALGGLVSLAAGLWFARFVSVALQRDDWIGWVALALLALAALAALAIVLREMIGILRLRRLQRLRAAVADAIAGGSSDAERAAASEVIALYAGRADLAWPLDRFREHAADIHDPGELLALADREIVARLDADARRAITRVAKRVATMTAFSPFALISVGYVLIENMRLLRSLATQYGGRPGVLGGLKLARLVLGHLIATGGVALTDDMLGQFLGQDILHRLSRRLGEGAVNGALTARVGIAATQVLRPLPYLAARPLRVRDILSEVFRTPSTRDRQSPQ